MDRDVLSNFVSYTVTKLALDDKLEYFDGNSWEILTVRECIKYELSTYDMAIIFE
jgi:hypothetical protein